MLLELSQRPGPDRAGRVAARLRLRERCLLGGAGCAHIRAEGHCRLSEPRGERFDPVELGARGIPEPRARADRRRRSQPHGHDPRRQPPADDLPDREGRVLCVQPQRRGAARLRHADHQRPARRTPVEGGRGRAIGRAAQPHRGFSLPPRDPVRDPVHGPPGRDLVRHVQRGDLQRGAKSPGLRVARGRDDAAAVLRRTRSRGASSARATTRWSTAPATSRTPPRTSLRSIRSSPSAAAIPGSSAPTPGSTRIARVTRSSPPLWSVWFVGKVGGLASCRRRVAFRAAGTSMPRSAPPGRECPAGTLQVWQRRR